MKNSINKVYLPWVLFALTLASLVIVLVTFWFPESTTRVYVVRHAEKVDSSEDPDLSLAGQERALDLRHTLQDENISQIYVSQFKRTQQTAAPVAQFVGETSVQYQAAQTAALADDIRDQHRGKNVLVVGHSNTVGNIVEALGVAGVGDLNEDQFDRLFVVLIKGDDAELQRLRYGAATP